MLLSHQTIPWSVMHFKQRVVTWNQATEWHSGTKVWRLQAVCPSLIFLSCHLSVSKIIPIPLLSSQIPFSFALFLMQALFNCINCQSESVHPLCLMGGSGVGWGRGAVMSSSGLNSSYVPHLVYTAIKHHCHHRHHSSQPEPHPSLTQTRGPQPQTPRMLYPTTPKTHLYAHTHSHLKNEIPRLSEHAMS